MHFYNTYLYTYVFISGYATLAKSCTKQDQITTIKSKHFISVINTNHLGASFHDKLL